MHVQITFICSFREGAAALTAPCTSLCFIWSRAAPLGGLSWPCQLLQSGPGCRTGALSSLGGAPETHRTHAAVECSKPWGQTKPIPIPPKTPSGPALDISLPRCVHTAPSCFLVRVAPLGSLSAPACLPEGPHGVSHWAYTAQLGKSPPIPLCSGLAEQDSL